MAPNVKIHVFAHNDLNGSVIAEITDEDSFFKSLKINPVRDGLGSGGLILARNADLSAIDADTFTAEFFCRLIISAYSDTVYYPWGFSFSKRQLTVIHKDEDGAEEFRLGGPGPKQYLDRGIFGIGSPAAGWSLDLTNGDWRFGDSATVGKLISRGISQDANEDDPALPDLTYTFNADDQSNGNPWSDTDLSGSAEQYRIPIGTSILQLLWDLDDLIELNSWIDLGTVASPKYELNINEGLGEDVTGSAFGAGVCLLREGDNIAEDALEAEGVSLQKVSHVVVEGAEGKWAEAVRPSFTPGDYVKRAKISYTRQRNVTWLEKAGLRWLKRQDYGEKEITVEILPGADDAAGLYFPAPDRVLWLSNLISLDSSADGTIKGHLDYQPTEEQLVTGFEMDLGLAGDTSSADKKAKSWDIKVQLNKERQGNVKKAPDQRSAASGGDSCKCLKLCEKHFISTDESWRAMVHASLAGGEINPEPADWKELGYDDSVSPWVDAELTASSFDDDTTEIKHPASDSFLKRHEFFFRKEYFISADDISGANVSFHYYADDGMDVYINGTLRLSVGTQWDADGPFNVSTTLDSDFFVPGLNVIAVYLWNQEHGTDGTAPNPGGCFFGIRIDILAADSDIGSDGSAKRCDAIQHAALTPIVDLGGFYDSDNVEGALQEIAGGGGGGSHATDHEDGGGDEIDLTDLSGIPAALASHMADTADAHDASAISVADAGGYFTDADVEAVLQELGAATPGSGGSFFAMPIIANVVNQFSTSSTTLVFTVTAPAVGDNLILVICSGNSRGPNAAPTQTNVTWTQRYQDNGNAQYVTIYTGVAAASAGTSITVNFTGSGQQQGFYFVVSGVEQFTAATSVGTDTGTGGEHRITAGSLTLGGYYIHAVSQNVSSSRFVVNMPWYPISAFSGQGRCFITRANAKAIASSSVGSSSAGHFGAVVRMT